MKNHRAPDAQREAYLSVNENLYHDGLCAASSARIASDGNFFPQFLRTIGGS